MKDEARINGAELPDTTALSIPIYSHTGTWIMAPPIPSIPPANPPAKPTIRALFIKFSVMRSS